MALTPKNVLLDCFASAEAELQLVIDSVETTVDLMQPMYDDIWTQMRELA